ncbi:hypothetical protein SAMN02910301_0518 [Lachnospiraceae bacterium XBD2001]|nr:hypothetical protein SAMN02910301_0518 [Lachnospiraceae bacterium XBD2001]
MAKKKRRLAAVFALVLAFSAVLGLNLGMREVRAANAYTVTFQVFGTHTVENDGGHLKIDGQFVELRNGDNNAIGEVTVNGTSASITVSDGTPGKLTYNSGNSFTLYDTNGHTPHSMDTEISSNIVFNIEDYADPNGGNNPGGSNPGGSDPGTGSQSNNTQVDAITFSIGGQSYTISDMSNPTVRVGADSIANLEFAITSVTLNGTPYYPLSGVGNGQYATAKNGENRPVLEIVTIPGGENTGSQWSVGLQYHGNDDEDENGRDPVNTTVPSFYIPQVTFASNTQRGVQVTSSTKPDMYDPMVYPAQVDISQSSRENPARTAVYYDSSDFSISEVNGTAVSSIAVTDGGTAGAVTITGNTVTFNSGYYTSIPLTVTLADGTVGYMQVDRLGIELRETRRDAGILYHGSEPGSNMATVAGAGTYNIAAVFYYDAAKDYTDYDMVANLTYSNGTTETRVVGGFAQMDCHTPTLKGGEYLIWSGESVDAMPASVSVTAVKHGAASGSSFGGALFGAGKGVTKNFK